MSQDFLPDGTDAAVHAHLGWLTFCDVEVRASQFNEFVEKLVDDSSHGNWMGKK
jgi:hypothetical protein